MTPPEDKAELPADIFHLIVPLASPQTLCALVDALPVARREVVPRYWAKQYPIAWNYFGSLGALKTFIMRTAKDFEAGTPARFGETLARLGVRHLSSGINELAKLLLDMDVKVTSRDLGYIIKAAMSRETTFALSNYTVFFRTLEPGMRSRKKWDSEMIWTSIAEHMTNILWQFVRYAELGNLARRLGMGEAEIETIAGSLAGSYYDDHFDAPERVQAFRDVALGRKNAPDGRLMTFGF